MDSTLRSLLRVAGVSAMIAPFLLAIADALLFADQMYLFSIVLWVSMALFVAAAVGLAALTRWHGSRLGFVAAWLVFFGAIAGASMQVLFRVHAVLLDQGQTAVVESLRQTTKLVASTQMIGIVFPLGLLILAGVMMKKGMLSAPGALALAVGAICFPMARIGGFEWAFIVGDLALIVAFLLLGKRMLRGETGLGEAPGRADAGIAAPVG